MSAHTHVMRAWSCTVRLVVDDSRALAPAAADLEALLDRIDRMASRFRADSALSVANANAGRPVPIPHLLADLVKASLDAAAQTDGAVDPTVGLAMHRIGYDCDIADDSRPRSGDERLPPGTWLAGRAAASRGRLAHRPARDSARPRRDGQGVHR